MPPLTPLTQTIFETGPRSPAAEATPVLQYEEIPTVIPNPINPALAIDPGIDWYALGEYAASEAGKLYEQLSEFVVAKADADVNDYIYDSQKKIFDLYGQAEATGFDDETTGYQLGLQLQQVEQDTKDKIAKRLNAPNLFEENFTLQGWGSNWFEAFTRARSGLAGLSASSEKIQKDIFTSGMASRQLKQELDDYGTHGGSIEPKKLEQAYNIRPLASNPDKVFNVNVQDPDFTPAERSEGVAQFSANMIPSNGEGEVSTIVKDRVKRLLGPIEGYNDQDLEVSLSLLGTMTPVQISHLGLSEVDSLRLASIRILGTAYSPKESREFLRKAPKSSYALSYVLDSDFKGGSPNERLRGETVAGMFDTAVVEYYKSVEQLHASSWGQQVWDRWTGDPLKAWGEFFATGRLSGPPTAGVEYSLKDGTPMVSRAYVTADDLQASPYMRSAKAAVMSMLLAHPELDVQKTLDEFLDVTIRTGSVYRTLSGDFEYVPLRINIGDKTKGKLEVFNRYRALEDRLTPETLAFSAQLASPLDTAAVERVVYQTVQSVDTALSMSHTVISPMNLFSMVEGIRNREKNQLGLDYYESASEAQIIQYAVASSDEVLKQVNGGVLPRTSQEIREALRKALDRLPTADRWQMQLEPTNGYLGINFVNIPFDNGNGVAVNMLTDDTIVPESFLYQRSLTLRNIDGTAHRLRVQHTARDSNGRFILLDDAKDIEKYLEKRIFRGKASTHDRGPSHMDVPGDRNFTKHVLDELKAEKTASTRKARASDASATYANIDESLQGPTENLLAELENLKTNYPNLADIGNNEDGTPVIIESKKQLRNLLTSPTARVNSVGFIKGAFGVTTEQATLIMDLMYTTDYGDGDDLVDRMFDKHAGSPLVHVYADIFRMVRTYYSPEQGVKKISFDETDQNYTPSAVRNYAPPIEVPRGKGKQYVRSPAFSDPWMPGGSGGSGGLGGSSVFSPPTTPPTEVPVTKSANNRNNAMRQSAENLIDAVFGEDKNPKIEIPPTTYNPYVEGYVPPVLPTDQKILSPVEVEMFERGQLSLADGDYLLPEKSTSLSSILNRDWKRWEDDIKASSGSSSGGGDSQNEPLEIHMGDFSIYPPYPTINKPAMGAVGRSDDTKPDVEMPTTRITRAAYPVVLAPDGGTTTIKFGILHEKDGPYLIVPIVADRKLLSGDEAYARYKQTGEHFGVFSTDKKAREAAAVLQNNEDTTVRKEQEAFVSFLTQVERFEPVAYLDRVGKWTIGIGSTTHPSGEEVVKGQTITKERAVEYVKHYVYTQILPAVQKIPTWDDMNINQKTAIISFAYNLGANFYGGPNRETITEALRTKKNLKNVPKALKLYIKGKINDVLQVIPGLVNRRNAEITLWNTPV